MSYSIEYKGNAKERALVCFKDVQSYLGEKNFILVVNALRDMPKHRGAAKLMLSFAGLQGLSADVMMAYAWRSKGSLMDWPRF
jgi:hypothetical protein